METLHFGLHIVKDCKFDAQNVAARLSSLTLDELRWITSELSVKALTNTLVDILGYEKQMDTDYANRLKTDQLILKEEFYALYNIDRPDASTEYIAIVEKLYACIKECDCRPSLINFNYMQAHV